MLVSFCLSACLQSDRPSVVFFVLFEKTSTTRRRPKADAFLPGECCLLDIGQIHCVLVNTRYRPSCISNIDTKQRATQSLSSIVPPRIKYLFVFICISGNCWQFVVHVKIFCSIDQDVATLFTCTYLKHFLTSISLFVCNI